VSPSDPSLVPVQPLRTRPRLIMGGLSIALVTGAGSRGAHAHEVGEQDAVFVSNTNAPAPVPFAYLGAKHMVTGYDHVLFLLGVIFLLRRLSEIAVYVTLFAVGHSITLIAGVLAGFGLNAHLVDAAIGISIIYKAFDNLGGFEATFGWRPDPRAMVFVFGLVHGLGLATKLHDLGLNSQGLVVNLVAFNVGVEIGQLVALSALFLVLVIWRGTTKAAIGAQVVNGLLLIAGFVLTGFQIAQYWFATSGAGS